MIHTTTKYMQKKTQRKCYKINFHKTISFLFINTRVKLKTISICTLERKNTIGTARHRVLIIKENLKTDLLKLVVVVFLYIHEQNTHSLCAL